ncbi:GNAT family N-acetyltransferase, partial [Streptomyces sp. WM6386]|uniref:GNAT family N-acetyltransferase n=1 Tax=Streptomyces sp. WM6386 TaxID=1415558 RepID=UPI001F225EC9
MAVSPACRGNGYATAVVARGSRLLVEAGTEEIRGDCDAANTSMITAFERADYENFADRQEVGGGEGAPGVPGVRGAGAVG